MIHLIDIGYCIFTAYVSAGLVHFYDFCIGEPDGEGGYFKGRIFSFWGKYLSEAEHAWSLRTDRLSPYKPLGVCMVCFGVYATTAVFVAAWLLFGLSWIYWLPTVVISTRLTRKWMQE
jgi:hypothetical protein